MKRFLILSLIPLLILISCKKDKQRTEATKIVNEWVGKQVKFPDEFTCSLSGEDVISTLGSDLLNKEYKVLLYVDSTGCTSCKLKLPVWKQIVEEADTLFNDQLGFLFYFQSKSKRELTSLLKREEFNYPVFIDPENKINQLNQFPDQHSFQCFLLDRENKVLMIGNPVYNPRIWELYKEQISGIKNNPDVLLTSVDVENKVYDYGEIPFNEGKEAVFKVKNTGREPLVINRINTSCGCTSVNWEKKPIDPGQTTEIKIIMKPDEMGYFNKTIQVYGNMENSPLNLKISGVTI